MKIGCSISEDNLFDAPIYQIFTHSTSPFERTLTDDQLKEYSQMEGKKIYVHSTFNTVIGHFFGRKCFSAQYKLCKKFGFAGLILHIPNVPVDDIVKGFKKIASPDTADGAVTVFLEHIPGEYGASTKLLRKLYDELSSKYPKYNFGICIDTCHIYSSGINLGDTSIMTKYLQDIEKFNATILVHLNDSIGELGSLIDRHAQIGTRIWTESNCSALRLLLAKPWDAVIELNSVDKVVASLNFINKIEKL